MKTFDEYFSEMWKEFEGRIPKALSKKVCIICAVCEEGWEPVTYSQYDRESGWSYKTCEPRDAYFVRHIATGKMYCWNQHRRIMNYNVSFAIGEITA